jgi:hypothetical protein
LHRIVKLCAFDWTSRLIVVFELGAIICKRAQLVHGIVERDDLDTVGRLQLSDEAVAAR